MQSATYKQIDEVIKQICTDAKEQWWNTKCAEIGELKRSHRSKQMHEHVKETTTAGSNQTGDECIKY